MTTKPSAPCLAAIEEARQRFRCAIPIPRHESDPAFDQAANELAKANPAAGGEDFVKLIMESATMQFCTSASTAGGY